MDIYTELKEKYQFLKPHNHLLDLPDGWVECFGRLFCEDLERAIEADNIKDYVVTQAKEKFGELRWYDNGGDAVTRVVDDYTHLSRHTCVSCGKLFVPILDTGWICPWCETCFKQTGWYSPAAWKKALSRESEEDRKSTTYKIKRISKYGSTILSRNIEYIIRRVDAKFKEN